MQTRIQRELHASAILRHAGVAGGMYSVPWLRLAGAVVAVVLVLLAFILVRSTGGSPNPLNHLGYPPVLLAAYLFGWRGGVLVGIVAGLALGPVSAVIHLGAGVETLSAWSIRAASFVGVGLVAGLLFDESRRHAVAWREAAVTVAARERDGIVALARGAEAKDTDTGDHIVRVQLLSEEIARGAGIDGEAASAIGWSAMLHDVGKLHIPDRILLKPGPLTADEWKLMKQHPIFGEEILARGEGFEVARRIARWHHENVDGTGYPDGLSGDRIPLEARIVRIADAFDAMTHDRPYQQGRSVEEALDELLRCAGTQFDPELVALTVALLADDALLRARVATHHRASPVLLHRTPTG